MEKWISRMLAGTKKYTIWDFGLLKIAVFAFGVLMGIYFPIFFLNIAGLLWFAFLLASAWIAYVTLVKYPGRK